MNPLVFYVQVKVDGKITELERVGLLRLVGCGT